MGQHVFDDPLLLQFSNGTMYNFEEDIPVLPYESISTMSDFEGNLMFYSDGERVANANHEIMPGSADTLMNGGYSSHNGCIIVPKPGSDSLYYVLYTPNGLGEGPPRNYYYGIVDMSLNEGLGDLIELNVIFCENSTEGMAVTQHANGVDYWIIVAPDSENVIKSYLLTEDGISENYTTSDLDVELTGIVGIRIAPTNCKAAVTRQFGYAGVFDFDPATGEFSNPMTIEKDSYGACFSPDGSKLYFFATGNGFTPHKLLQYSMDYEDNQSLIESEYEIVEDLSAVLDLQANHANLQITPYGEIMMTRFHEAVWLIPYPNLYGDECGLDLSTYILLNGKAASPPRFPETWLNVTGVEGCSGSLSTEIAQALEIYIYPNPSNGEVFIDLPNQTEVTLMDMTGKEVMTTSLMNGKVDLGEIEPGMYLIRAGSMVQRLVLE